MRKAERLNVRLRTVYRHIGDLSLNGLPLYGEARNLNPQHP